ncbi:MAG: Eco57I restriction-modification methylase domain-containing protein, partial [Candidatus Binatia bacterium]
WRERALPDLGNNIKCGNSLIGSDFYENRQMSLLDDEERYRINVFDWKTEFPDVFPSPSGRGTKGEGQGGFDAVIGNPPYVFGRDWKALKIGDDVKAYLGRRYESSPYQLDMFSIFMEKASLLCRPLGYVGQIVPNVWLTNTYSSTTRAFILNHANELNITTPPRHVFPGLTVDTILYTFQKTNRPGKTFQIKAMRNDTIIEIATCDTEQYIDGYRPISTALDQGSTHLLSRLKQNHSELQDVALVTRGVHPYRTGGYGQSAFGSGPQTIRDVKERPYHSQSKEKGYRPFIYGRDLRRFSPPKATEFVKYGPWLAEPRQPEFFQGERVYSRKILGDRLVATIETTDSVADQQVYIARPKTNDVSAMYLGGVLGSRLIAFFIRGFYDEVNDAFPQIKVGQLKSLPIPAIDESKRRDKHDRMVDLVKRMLDLYKQLASAKNPNHKTSLQREIEATDRQIDRLVYELYGLTEEEIKIVEEGETA